MAVTHQFQMPAHPSIYEFAERELKITLSYPEHGTNEDTGIVVLLPSYGQTIDSPVLAEARSRIADELNMVTVQCDYFGLEFMQGIQTFSFQTEVEVLRGMLSEEHQAYVLQGNSLNSNRLLEIGRNYPLHLRGKEVLNETNTNFNDMGLMQAVDIVSAVLAVRAVLEDNKFTYNREKVILSGSGHGAYLAYLCNAIVPRMFNQIIDYSGYLISPYLKSSRYLSSTIGSMRLDVEFSYLVNRMESDLEFLDLSNLYRKFQNYCNIVVCYPPAQSKDMLKVQFCNSIVLCMQYELSQEQFIKSDNTQIIDYVLRNFKTERASRSSTLVPSHSIITNKYRYHFDCTAGVLVVSRKKSNTSKK